MEFTGVRFVPGMSGRIELEHLQRYALCRTLVRGRRVLDIASGEGYGAAMLARTARQVVGVDADPEAVAHAQATYGREHLSFAVGRCEAIPVASRSVEGVVCFETIEHVDDQERLLDEIARVLTPAGILVISTPDREAYAADANGANPFHVRELSLPEFEARLRERFGSVRLWGQRAAVGTFTYALDGRAGGLTPLVVEGHEVREGVPALPAPVYGIAVCTNGPPGEAALDSVAVDPADDYYATLAATIRAYEVQLREQAASLGLPGERRKHPRPSAKRTHDDWQQLGRKVQFVAVSGFAAALALSVAAMAASVVIAPLRTAAGVLAKSS